MEVAGANRRWRCQFRYRGSRRESAVAQLSTFDDMRLILILLMVTGGVIAIQPAFSRAKVTALWSDFKAFQARVAERPDGKTILALGGESSAESFEDLLRKLFELRVARQFHISASSFLHFRRLHWLWTSAGRRRSNQAAASRCTEWRPRLAAGNSASH